MSKRIEPHDIIKTARHGNDPVLDSGGFSRFIWDHLLSPDFKQELTH